VELFKDINYKVNDEVKWHQMAILMSVLPAFGSEPSLVPERLECKV